MVTYKYENAEMVLINPLYPPILGDFLRLGGHPQSPGRKYPLSLFQWSYKGYSLNLPADTFALSWIYTSCLNQCGDCITDAL